MENQKTHFCPESEARIRDFVLQSRWVNVSLVQRKLRMGYGIASAALARLEEEGIIGPANAEGQREVLKRRVARPDALEAWVNSFSGCDGGSLEAQTWLCGIEWGSAGNSEQDAQERQTYYGKILPTEISRGSVALNQDYRFFTEESAQYPFNWALIKLYAAIHGLDASKYLDISDEVLKLNLFPIAFQKDDHALWSESLQSAVDFPTKESFKTYVSGFSRFAALRAAHKPRLIIGVGAMHARDFLKAFFGDAPVRLQKNAIRPASTNGGQSNRYLRFARHDETLLAVIPFATRPNGLNSDYLLQETGKMIRDLLEE
ncbi:MAG: DNA translocase FtsK [Castellaniella sp.]